MRAGTRSICSIRTPRPGPCLSRPPVAPTVGWSSHDGTRPASTSPGARRWTKQRAARDEIRDLDQALRALAEPGWVWRGPLMRGFALEEGGPDETLTKFPPEVLCVASGR